MSASACVFILTFTTLSSGVVGVPPPSGFWVNGTVNPPCPADLSGVPGSPTNVQLTSYNMNLVLSWDPPEGACSGLIYTTMLKNQATSMLQPGCVNVSALQCDLTDLDVFHYGTYTGHVQALWGGRTSDWGTSDKITMDKDTIIGPPGLTLRSTEGNLEVSIKDPVFKISTLKQIYQSVSYSITYWKEGEEKKARNIPHIEQNWVVLDDLDPSSRYCVQAQLNSVRNPRPGTPSSAVCESTTESVVGVPPPRGSWVNGTVNPPCPADLSGVPGSPTNVQLTSYNMNLVLSWAPPEGACSGLIYTTMLKNQATPMVQTGCVNVSALQCDLTDLDVFHYGTYTGHVQALWGGRSSDWGTSDKITMDKDTIIGPPGVTLRSIEGNLEVSIKDPVFKISTLKQIYQSVSYSITYWKEGEEKKARNIPHIEQNWVVLDDLDPSSRYCVQAQLNSVRNPRPGTPSSAVCESTTEKKGAPWLAAVVVSVVMAAVVSLVLVLVLKWRSISQFFYPKDALIQHYPESLLKPFNPSGYPAMPSMEPVEEISHKVTVEERVLVEAESS